MRSIALGALSLLVTAAAVAVPVTTATPAQAAVTAPNCEVWRSSGAALTGFGRCVTADGYPRFQIKVRCSNGTLIYSPIVRLGQTTWATCTAAQGIVGSIQAVGKN
ncbi:hypothetical protein [Kribbella sp. CA-293567]|uniref:hypothetical protein n=1 Tax=Kribbella sp. CA-293567 TaxID=3002436 RepID=UPI0022DE135C|nr:hypothetical protein [Kribbella sp. CA-293567]WBQ04276.1 hypothetical protein OX958_30450 [Kribbella sp. CA-293567]